MKSAASRGEECTTRVARRLRGETVGSFRDKEGNPKIIAFTSVTALHTDLPDVAVGVVRLWFTAAALLFSGKNNKAKVNGRSSLFLYQRKLPAYKGHPAQMHRGTNSVFYVAARENKSGRIVLGPPPSRYPTEREHESEKNSTQRKRNSVPIKAEKMQNFDKLHRATVQT